MRVIRISETTTARSRQEPDVHAEIQQEIHQADLVIDASGEVIKDRDGRVARPATHAELDQAVAL